MTRIIQKKFLAVILTLAMVVSLLPAVTLPASAAGVTTSISGELKTTYSFNRPDISNIKVGGVNGASTNIYVGPYIDSNTAHEGVIYSNDDNDYNYFTVNFTPTVAGNYTFTVTSAEFSPTATNYGYETSTAAADDTTMYIYLASSFNPSNPLEGLMYGQEDIAWSGTYYSNSNNFKSQIASGATTADTYYPTVDQFSAETAYTLVLTSCTHDVTGPINVNITGPGSVTISSNDYTSGYATAPTVATQAVTDIAATTATGNGNITALGSANPTAYGVCWSTSETPTTSDSKVDKGAAAATGAFTSSMTGLSANTTYYVRAYATNSAGTSYGEQVSFKTSASATKLSTPGVLAWDTTIPSKATWGAASNASSYTVQLYKGGVASGSAVSTTNAYYDFLSAITETGSYTFTVTAVGNGTTYSNSDASSASAAYSYTAPEDKTVPSLTSGAASRTSDTTATVKFTSDESGAYYYGVADSGATAPTIDTNGTGTSCTTSETTITLDSASLSAGAKDVYIKVKDAAGNVSDALKIVLFSAGGGTSAAPYEISTEDELNAVRNYPGCYFKQISDITIDATKYPSWSPIGTAPSPFTGSYNGGSYKIDNLKINTTADSSADTVLGLFGVVGTGAVLSNIKLDNMDIDVAAGSGTNESFIGGLAGINRGTITDCNVAGTLDATAYEIELGGLAGRNGDTSASKAGVITNSTSNCTINATVQYQMAHIGGLAGASYCTGSSITNCNSSGTITGIGGSTVNHTGIFSGGLVGNVSDTTITSCSSDCATIAKDARSQAHAGGLIGKTAGSCSISGCSSSGNATASDAAGSTATKVCAGGLIGYSVSNSTITNSFSTGNATATGTGSSASSSTYVYVYAGGFLGYISSGSGAVGITQCYATGSASATVNTYGYAFAGGFGGYYTYVNIAKNYSTGSAQAVSAAGYASAGGFTGYLYGANATTSPSTATNCYSTGNAGASCADNERAGGFSGVIQNSTASYCYSAGIPSAAHTAYALKCGGFTGANTAGTINNCYYDGTISGKTDTDRGTPMSTSDMKISSFITTLTNAGATWKLVSNLNSGYPVIDGVGLGALLTCAVTYKDGSDTSTAYGTDTVAQGIVFSLPSTIRPTKSGSTLSGWYSDSTCGSTYKWDFATQTASAGTLTLFAGWQTSSATKLSTPGTLAWDTTTPAKATWGAVTNAGSYSVQLYKGGVASGSAVSTANAYFDFTSAITETGSYTFTVTAVGNGTTYSNSDASSASAAYSYTATYTATINTTIDGAAADVTSVALKSAGATLTASKTSTGVYTFSVPDGTYNIYVNGAYAGKSITI